MKQSKAGDEDWNRQRTRAYHFTKDRPGATGEDRTKAKSKRASAIDINQQQVE